MRRDEWRERGRNINSECSPCEFGCLSAASARSAVSISPCPSFFSSSPLPASTPTNIHAQNLPLVLYPEKQTTPYSHPPITSYYKPPFPWWNTFMPGTTSSQSTKTKLIFVRASA